MGAYYTYIKCRLFSTRQNLKIARGNIVVFSDYALSALEITDILPGFKYLLLINPIGKGPKIKNVRYAKYIPFTVPLSLSPDAYGAISFNNIQLGVFLWPVSHTAGRSLYDLYKCGIKRCYFLTSQGWKEFQTKKLIINKALVKIKSCFLYKKPALRSQHNILEDILKNNRKGAVEIGSKKPLRIIHYIGSLGPGGSEQQLCNLSVHTQKRGYDVSVLTTNPMTDHEGYHSDFLANHNIRHWQCGENFNNTSKSSIQDFFNKRTLCLVDNLPENIATPVLDLLGELIVNPPDVLHCWLDYGNIIGALAAYIADVPRIILCTRNVNPSHFPHWYQDWMKTWYPVFLQNHRVCITGNSMAGISDYAHWLKIPKDRFQIIHNGVDCQKFHTTTPEEKAKCRHLLGIPHDVPLILGAFRIDPEKRPFDFINVIKQVKRDLPYLRALIVGTGRLEKELIRHIKTQKLGNVIQYLGVSHDISSLIHASDIVLLTSQFEGTPNILIEAQLSGCPVIATKAGGVSEAVSDGKTGILCDIGDIEEICLSVKQVLTSKSLHSKMAQKAPLYAKRKFDMNRMVDKYVSLYQ